MQPRRNRHSGVGGSTRPLEEGTYFEQSRWVNNNQGRVLSPIHCCCTSRLLLFIRAFHENIEGPRLTSGKGLGGGGFSRVRGCVDSSHTGNIHTPIPDTFASNENGAATAATYPHHSSHLPPPKQASCTRRQGHTHTQQLLHHGRQYTGERLATATFARTFCVTYPTYIP